MLVIVEDLWCEFPKATGSRGDDKHYTRTKARAVWFAEKTALQGMMLQCPLPTDEVTANPTFDFTFVWDKAAAPQSGKMALSMCPNKHAEKKYNMVLCTTSQFGTSIKREDIVEWFEYHRLAGVDHVYWRERVGQ